MTPIDELRRATRTLHERLDALPYAADVAHGGVRLDEYASLPR